MHRDRCKETQEEREACVSLSSFPKPGSQKGLTRLVESRERQFLKQWVPRAPGS